MADVPEPEPGPNEVLVAVRACGINFPDGLLIRDKYQIRPPRPFAPGSEIAGIVAREASGGQGLGTLAKSLAFEQFKPSWVLYGNVVTWPAFLDPHPALFDAPRAQQERYLWPILEGTAQYHICISEPDFGSDVASIETTAVRKGDTWVINGRKRWSPDPFHPFLVPNYLLVYAVTDPGRGAKGISTFLVDWPSDGVKVLRTMESVAPGTFLGKVCDLEFDNCIIPAENLLGLANEGFHYVQDQLNRNRAVIGMGAVGLAQRCQDIATEYARERRTFGKRLAEHQAIQWKIAESAMDIEAGRLRALKAAWKIDQGEDARFEAAVAKAYCLACRVIDPGASLCWSPALSCSKAHRRRWPTTRPFAKSTSGGQGIEPSRR